MTWVILCGPTTALLKILQQHTPGVKENRTPLRALHLQQSASAALLELIQRTCWVHRRRKNYSTWHWVSCWGRRYWRWLPSCLCVPADNDADNAFSVTSAFCFPALSYLQPAAQYGIQPSVACSLGQAMIMHGLGLGDPLPAQPRTVKNFATTYSVSQKKNMTP